MGHPVYVITPAYKTTAKTVAPPSIKQNKEVPGCLMEVVLYMKNTCLRLRLISLRLIYVQLSFVQENLSEIREAFNVFDKDGNGYITASELRHFLSSLGYNMTEAELMDMMNKIGNGKLRAFK